MATLEDADRLDALMKASAAAIFPNYYDAAQTESAIRNIARVDPDIVRDGTYFVLEAAGDVGSETPREAENETSRQPGSETLKDVVACGGWSRRGRVYMGSADAPGDERYLDPATEAAHIRAMYVREDWTRRGLGRRIIEASEDAARAMGFRRMDLVATLPGIPLYRAAGYEATADIEDIVLADGVRLPCQAMTKSLERAGT